MTQEELIYFGAINIFNKMDDKVPMPNKMEVALELAADIYGRLPKYVEYANKRYCKEKERLK